MCVGDKMSEAKVINIKDYLDSDTVKDIIDELKTICKKYNITHNTFAFTQKGNTTYLDIQLLVKL